jgi:hypothetical protein
MYPTPAKSGNELQNTIELLGPVYNTLAERKLKILHGRVLRKAFPVFWDDCHRVTWHVRIEAIEVGLAKNSGGGGEDDNRKL